MSSPTSDQDLGATMKLPAGKTCGDCGVATVAKPVKPRTQFRDYLADVIGIIDGAADRHESKVIGFADRLANRLAADGHAAPSNRVRAAAVRHKKLAGSLTPLPVDKDSRMGVVEEFPPDPGIALFLPEEPRKIVRRFIRLHRATDRLIAAGVGTSGSMLVYGPPGCGKTQLAKYVAGQLELPMFMVRMDSVFNSHQGSTGHNIRDIFGYIESRPCVLFLDEIDAIAGERASCSNGSAASTEARRTVIALLQNLDRVDRSQVVIAATNHEGLLDSAAWRRFTCKLQLPEPDFAARVGLFRHFLGRFGDEELIRWSADNSCGLTGSRIRDACEESIRDAVVDDKPAIDRDLLSSYLHEI